MSKSSKATRSLPTIAARVAPALGNDIAVARKRRRLSQKLMAEKMMVNVETLRRLERGDPAIAIGIVAAALWTLGMSERLERLVAPETDLVGQNEEIRRLPKSVRSPESSSDLDF